MAIHLDVRSERAALCNVSFKFGFHLCAAVSSHLAHPIFVIHMKVAWRVEWESLFDSNQDHSVNRVQSTFLSENPLIGLAVNVVVPV